ncbi:MAG: hypothetical protein HC813_02485 [Planctomycetes bacterium]|nr:hypothetical protein [Planctomycetota bacterium]
MPLLFRILQILRKGPRPQRMQAWAGLLLVVVACAFIILKLLGELILALLALAGGIYLLGRSLR